MTFGHMALSMSSQNGNFVNKGSMKLILNPFTFPLVSTCKGRRKSQATLCGVCIHKCHACMPGTQADNRRGDVQLAHNILLWPDEIPAETLALLRKTAEGKPGTHCFTEWVRG